MLPASTRIMKVGLLIFANEAPLQKLTRRTVEMASWRPVRHLLGRDYMKAYFQIVPSSAPEEDQDDRNLLYYLYVLRSFALAHGQHSLTPAKPMGSKKLCALPGETPISRNVRNVAR